MSSDDEFDDLFSFSSPTKTDTSNANGVDSDTTNKAASDDDFLDDVSVLVGKCIGSYTYGKHDVGRSDRHGRLVPRYF